MEQLSFEKLMAKAAAVSFSEYAAKCSAKRARAMERLYLFARQGFPAVNLALTREDLLLMVNILIAYICDGNRDYRPIDILNSALKRMRSVAAGKTLRNVVYKLHDRTGHPWLFADDLATILYTKGEIEVENIDLQSIGDGSRRELPDPRPEFFRRRRRAADDVADDNATRGNGDEGSAGGGAPNGAE